MRHSIPHTLVAFFALIAVACTSPAGRVSPPDSQILFVCEHGNVKSLMAASYFNRLANQRGLPYLGVSRGTAPESTTVPPAIISNLGGEGFDVAGFHPVAVRKDDVSASRRVILINTALPPGAHVAGASIEQWTDVPPASTNYSAASAALKRHIETLIDDLSRSAPN